MKYASTLFELDGMAAITTGAYQIVPWAGWVVGGALAILIGAAMSGST